MREAKQLLPSLKEALDTIKPKLQDEEDIIDFDWHMYRHKDLKEKYYALESDIIPPLSNSPPPELNSDEKILPVTPSYVAIDENGSLSTIVFTTSSEFENKQERFDIGKFQRISIFNFIFRETNFYVFKYNIRKYPR